MNKLEKRRLSPTEVVLEKRGQRYVLRTEAKAVSENHMAHP